MYYIYHIPGIKIGCTLNPKRRVHQQGYSEFEILEEYCDIQEASIRERELQRKYNYEVDCKSKIYSSQFSDMGKKGGGKHSKKQLEWRKMAGKLLALNYVQNQGKSNVESGHIFKIGTFEGRSIAGKKSRKAVLVYKFKTNELVGEYISLKNACESLNLSVANASMVCNNKQIQTAGYKLKWKEYEKN